MIGRNVIARLRALADMSTEESYGPYSWCCFRIRRKFTKELKHYFTSLVSAAEQEYRWETKYNEVSAANNELHARIKELEDDSCLPK